MALSAYVLARLSVPVIPLELIRVFVYCVVLVALRTIQPVELDLIRSVFSLRGLRTSLSADEWRDR